MIPSDVRILHIIFVIVLYNLSTKSVSSKLFTVMHRNCPKSVVVQGTFVC